MSTINICNRDIQTKEYEGKRVVTFKDIDIVHQRPTGTARRNFNKNKKYLLEGEDYFRVCVDEIRTNKIMDISSKARNDIVMMTESGYLLLVKSFTDDLSWDVQRQLVNAYFQAKDIFKEITDKYKNTYQDFRWVVPKDEVLVFPKKETWFTKNYKRMMEMCTELGITLSTLYAFIIRYVKQKYNLEMATEVYKAECPDTPFYIMNVIGYFQNLAECATYYLDKLEEWLWEDDRKMLVTLGDKNV